MSVRIKDEVTPDLNRIRQRLDDLAVELLPEVKRNTPKRTGNARRRTVLKSNNKVIESAYPYAVRLDNGHSRQAPNGFVRPSLKWLRIQIRKILKGQR